MFSDVTAQVKATGRWGVSTFLPRTECVHEPRRSQRWTSAFWLETVRGWACIWCQLHPGSRLCVRGGKGSRPWNLIGWEEVKLRVKEPLIKCRKVTGVRGSPDLCSWRSPGTPGFCGGRWSGRLDRSFPGHELPFLRLLLSQKPPGEDPCSCGVNRFDLWPGTSPRLVPVENSIKIRKGKMSGRWIELY